MPGTGKYKLAESIINISKSIYDFKIISQNINECEDNNLVILKKTIKENISMSNKLNNKNSLFCIIIPSNYNIIKFIKMLDNNFNKQL